MQIKAAVKKFFTANWRQKLTLLSSGFIIYVILLTGIFSYFHSEDTVTNRLDAKSGSVTVHEPAWDKEGQKMAQASEPGMKIPKNPFGTNDGQVDEYIRLKMTVTLDDFDDTSKTDTYITKYSYSNAERLDPIINALRLIGKDDNGQETNDPFLVLNTTGTVSNWSITTNNIYYYTDGSNHSGNDDELVFYFYYKADNTDGKLRAVKPGNSTAELFQRVDIPIYKKDYLGVFDQGYTVTIQAEAIPAVNYPEGLLETDAPNEFV